MMEQKPEYTHRVIIDLNKPSRVTDENMMKILSAELHYIDNEGNRHPMGFNLADLYLKK